MNQTVVIDGEITLTQLIDGDMVLETLLDGEIDKVFFVDSHQEYEGPYEVTPSPEDAITLETASKTMRDDVTVKKIPYYETANEWGNTVYIGSEV